jgi:hypothetical protein
MFEVGIISIVVLAVSYWVTLWLMSRHDDVLHGDFVHAEDGDQASPRPDPLLPVRPSFPPKPVIKRRAISPAAVKRAAIRPVAAKPDVVKPAAMKAAPTETWPAQPSPAPAPSTSSERLDTLQSLLASIKRDLKDASQL